MEKEANAFTKGVQDSPVSPSGRRMRTAGQAGMKAVRNLLEKISEDADTETDTEVRTARAARSRAGERRGGVADPPPHTHTHHHPPTHTRAARASQPAEEEAKPKRGRAAKGAAAKGAAKADGKGQKAARGKKSAPAPKTGRKTKRGADDGSDDDFVMSSEPSEGDADGSSGTESEETDGEDDMDLDGQQVSIWDDGPARENEAARASPSDMDDFVEEDKPKRKPLASRARAPAKRARAPAKRSATAIAAGGGAASAKGDDPELPAIRDPQLMFTDMVKRMVGIVGEAKKDKAYAALGDDLTDMIGFAQGLDRPLRVATMCSGTESPLLALGMISKSLKEHHDVPLDIDHVFSCEIEPFKQGYIERNFAPPILFRDIRELGDERAHTAWGALVDVPGNVDILIAGTSCVDYSNLNNEKKELDAQGESGQTFRGMMRWIDRFQPPLIILENVCGAPWERIRQDFLTKHNYHAAFTRFDTKNYYIPHTRMRVYLVATPVRPDVAKKVQAKLQEQLKAGTLPHGGHLDPNTLSVEFTKAEGASLSKKKKEDAARKWFEELEAIAAEDPASKLPGAWKDLVKRMGRSSSSVLEAFLLPNDDPRVHSAREKLANKGAARSQGKGTDWARCEARHQRARLEEGLGAKRPFTNWEDGAQCELYDYAWTDWARAQTDRVLDLMDIDFLRLASEKEVDPSFKTLVWNLSQNVDRTTGSVKPGICPCLTPSMVPFVTNRGGPLVGVEALSLQGIPVDDLILTRETEDQMADLAGNAMSSTVVGVCSMVALALGQGLVYAGPGKDAASRSAKAGQGETAKAVPTDAVDGDLEAQPLILSPSSDATAAELLAKAQETRRFCVSEGQTAIAETISVCKDCGHTVSGTGGRPKHNFVTYEGKRSAPGPFASALKAALPMRIALDGFDANALKKATDAAIEAGAGKKLAGDWADMLKPLEGEAFYFRSINRAASWTASYAGRTSGATLDLLLDGDLAEWRLSVPPPVEKGALRDLLVLPVARLRVPADTDAKASLLGGTWELRLPARKDISVTMTGAGEPVPSWQASMGLVKKVSDSRFPKWTVQVDAKDKALLDEDIAGEYTLLPDCDAAMASLHKRGGGKKGAAKSPLFFFLDAGVGGARCSYKEADHFVFSRNHRRLAYGEERGSICRLSQTWRPHAVEGSAQVGCEILGQWSSVGGLVSFSATGTGTAVASPAATPSRRGRAGKKGKASSHEAVIEMPKAAPAMSLRGDTWKNASTIVKCSFPRPEADAKLFPKGDWYSLPLDKSTAEFKRLAWITERIELPTPLRSWNEAQGGVPSERSEVCAPSPPAIQWVLDHKGKVAAREDPQGAADFERRSKSRPPPFLVQLRGSGADGSEAQLRVAVNTPSLGHRSLALLPHPAPDADVSDTKVMWRIVAENDEPPVTAGAKPAPFVLSSNKKDKAAKQPPSFKKYPLRPEQLRSLNWMLNQENNPKPFVEEEVTEARLPALRWRAEGRAEREVTVRGGVVADQVGYGKTAITLGLIDSQVGQSRLVSKGKGGAVKVPGAIRVGATLVLAPPHLLKQWPNEVRKFTGTALNMEVVNTVADLNRLTIKRIQEVDVIVMASSVFRSEAYFERMAALGGVSKQLAATKTNARHFEATYKVAVENIGDRVDELMGEGGSASVHASILETANAALELTDLNPKRLKGAALVNATELAMSKGFRTHGGMLGKVAGEGTKVKSEDREEDAPAAKKQKGSKGKPRCTVKAKIAEGSAKTSVKDSNGPKIIRSDPWGLTSPRTRSDWTNMACPPLEFFHWERVVVDEFTYLKGRDLAAIQALKASHKWILSGTPPVGSFSDIKGIAQFLGVHLGVDEAPKFTKKEQTKAETFAFYREKHTDAWQTRRRGVAQTFLDTFVRQNVAEIDEIRRVQEDIHVNLLPAERAIYLELDHHLQAMDMQTTRKWRKGAESGDRVARLKEVLGSSATAEEALMKRCAHFDLSAKANSALETCEEIVGTREGQLLQCKEELVAHIKVGYTLDRMCELWTDHVDKEYATDSKHETVPFLRWIRTIKNESSGDPEATKELRRLVAKATAEYDEMKKKRLPMSLPSEPSRLFDGKWNDPWAENPKLKVESETYSEWAKQRKFYAREWTHAIRRLEKEIVGRERSLRYFRAVRDLQKNKWVRVVCPVTGKKLAPKDHGVLSCCGHQGDLTIMRQRAALQRCVVEDCEAPVRATNVVERVDLGTDDQTGESEAGGTYGSKLKELVRAINEVPQNERVLVFVQFPDLAELVCKALNEAGIDTLELKGAIYKKTAALDIFQREEPQPGDARVLLLNQSDESASGANLTTANHAIFVHPLLAATQQEYNQGLTQAVGRVCRYGQKKLVHIRHLLVDATMDTVVFEERGGISCCV